jgi:GNAT superfamily N-acetyltransferase
VTGPRPAIAEQLAGSGGRAVTPADRGCRHLPRPARYRMAVPPATPTPESSGAREPVGTDIRSMARGDLPFVLRQHRSAFPDNVMGRMGPIFLRRYYRTFLDGPFAVAVVAERHGRPVGYLVGILDTARHRRRLLRRHGAALAVALLIGFALHPVLVTRTMTSRASKALSSKRAADDHGSDSGPADGGDGDVGSEPGPVAVLSHVAVPESSQRLGVGRRLVDFFVEEARAAGCAEVCLATLDDADGAWKFYERLGWELTSTRRTFDGRPLRFYCLRLGDGR